MISHMETIAKRTTLILQTTRFVDLKQLAAERGQTLSAVVDEFLAEGLRRARAPKAPLVLPSYDLGKALVDIDDREALAEVMGDNDFALYR